MAGPGGFTSMGGRNIPQETAGQQLGSLMNQIGQMGQPKPPKQRFTGPFGQQSGRHPLGWDQPNAENMGPSWRGIDVLGPHNVQQLGGAGSGIGAQELVRQFRGGF